MCAQLKERMGGIIKFLLEVEEDEIHLKNASVQAREAEEGSSRASAYATP